MNKPILSIIIPMYNSKKFIKKTIESIIIPNLEEIEVIIVNDGSNDNSTTIVDPYCIAYPSSIKLVNKENGGHGSAINLGISISTGKYLKVLDADDWFKTEELISLLKHLKTTNTEVIITDYFTYNIKTELEVLHKVKTIESSTTLSLIDILSTWHRVSNGFTIHGILYLSSFYKSLNIKLPEHVYYDDACFVTIPCCYASFVSIFHHPIYVYRIGDIEQSVSNISRVKRIDDLEIIIKTLLNNTLLFNNVSDEGKLFWEIKTLSYISDYYITALLRNSNRKLGRMQARNMKSLIDRNYPILSSKLSKRYFTLFLLHMLHIKEKNLQKFMNVKFYSLIRNLLFH